MGYIEDSLQPQALKTVASPGGPRQVGYIQTQLTRPGLVRAVGGGDRTFGEATGGAFLYGGAETGATLASYGQRWAPDSQWLGEVKNSLLDFTASHPEYSPKQVSSAWDLITSPAAISGRIFSGAPYMLASMAATELAPPFVGIPLAMGLTYAIENQNAYQTALESGASEEQAQRVGQITGSVNAIFQLGVLHGIYSFARGGESALMKAAVAKSGFMQVALGLTGQAAKHLSIVGLENALMGSTSELAALGIYGKPVEEGFLDRRLQDAFTGAALAGVFGIGKIGLSRVVDGNTVRPKEPGDSTVSMDAFTPQDLYNKFHNEYKLPHDQANAAVFVTNMVARRYASDNGGTPEQWYGKAFQNAVDGLDAGRVTLMQSPEAVGGFYSKLSSVLASPTIPEKGESRQILAALQNAGVKPEELLWTGIKGVLENSTRVSKEELQKYLETNAIHLTETMKGYDVAREQQSQINDLRGQIMATLDQGNDLLKMSEKEKDPVKEQQIQAALEEKKTQAQDLQSRYETLVGATDGLIPVYTDYRTPGPSSDYRELLLRLPDLPELSPEGERIEPQFQEEFKHAHWTEPNVVVHTRFDTREVGGKKVLFVNEIQSDWHQKGRNQGYLSPGERRKVEARVHEFKQELGDLEGRADALETQLRGLHPDTPEWDDIDTAWKENQTKQGKLHQQMDEMLREAGYQVTPAVTAAPFSKTWVDLVIKRLLMHAVETGHDSIAFASSELVNRIFLGQSELQEANKNEFYDKILPGKVRDVLRGMDKEAKLKEVGIEGAVGASVRDVRWEGKEVGENRISQLIDEHDRASRVFQNDDQRHASEWNIGQFYRGVHKKMAFGGMPERQAIQESLLETSILGRHRTEELATIQKELGGEAKVPPPRSAKVLGVTISDKMREKIIDGLPLFQTDKGSVTFLSNGRAVLQALSNPDVSTAMHELFHVYRRWMNPEDLKVLEGELGVENGGWDTRAEEAAARSFERYLREGQAPSGELVSVFGKFKEWLKSIYRVMKGSSIDVPLTDRMKAVFDHMLSEDSDAITAKRGEIEFLKSELSHLNKTQVSTDESDKGVLRMQLGRKGMEERLTRAESDLVRLKELRYTPRDPSAAENRAVEYRDLPGKLDVEPPDVSKLRRHLTSAFDSINSALFNMRGPLMRTVGGRTLDKILREAETFARSASGSFEQRKMEVMRGLTREDVAWLMEDDGDFSNVRRLIDRVGTPNSVDAPNERIRLYQQLHHEVDDFTTSEAVRLGVLRELPSGSFERLKRSSQDRLPRMLTEDAWSAIQSKAGPIYTAIVDAVERLNPTLKRVEIEEELQQRYAGTSVYKLGQLEKSRKIQYFPDVIDERGTKVSVMHTEPWTLISRSIDRQTKRLGLVEQAGQGILRNVGKDKLAAVAKALGVGIPKRTVKRVTEELIDRGVEPEWFDGKSPAEVAKMARAHEVETSTPRAAYLDAIMGVAPGDLDAAAVKRLRVLAKDIRGISSKSEPSDLLIAVKERVKNEVEDNLVKRLRDLHEREGGNVEDFDNVLRVWQGLPYHNLGRGAIARSLRFVSNLIGVAQTSGSVAPNLPQPLSLVPAFSGVKNFSEAMRTVITDREMTKASLAGMGVFKYTPWILHAEPGYSMERWGGLIRRAAGALTGLQFVADTNVLVAGETFRLMAQNLKLHGASEGDVVGLRKFGLSEKELSEVREPGGMTDRTFKKIIQNGVAKTQFVTEDPTLRGKIENIPLARMLFAYSSYTFGQSRAVRDMAKELKDGFTTSPAAAIASGGRLLTMLAGGAGAGVLSILLRESLKGQQFQEGDDSKDSWWDKVAGGLWEVQIMGATTRMLEPFKYDGGVIERSFVGFMPQVGAVLGLLSAVFHYGKWGEFDSATRFSKAGQKITPLARGFFNTVEEIAWPDSVGYDRTRSAVGAYARDVLHRDTNVGETQLNPDYYGVFQAARRGDFDLAQSEMGKLLTKKMEEGIDPLTELSNLRSSLTSRAPIALNDSAKLGFLLSHASSKQRADFLSSQITYMNIVNGVAPNKGDSTDRKGKYANPSARRVTRLQPVGR